MLLGNAEKVFWFCNFFDFVFGFFPGEGIGGHEYFSSKQRQR
jgi:hypothetical protein